MNTSAIGHRRLNVEALTSQANLVCLDELPACVLTVEHDAFVAGLLGFRARTADFFLGRLCFGGGDILVGSRRICLW